MRRECNMLYTAFKIYIVDLKSGGVTDLQKARVTVKRWARRYLFIRVCNLNITISLIECYKESNFCI